MKMFYKSQHKIVLMVILALLFQIVGPVAGDYVYAIGRDVAFNFHVVQQEDGSGRFEWTYNPNKANGETEFEIDLKLQLTAEFLGELYDREADVTIGEFTISKDGILTATIYEIEPEEVEEPEEEVEPKLAAKMVEIKENKVIVKLEVEESLEGQTAKIEILKEDGEVLEEAEIEVDGNLVIAEFENLEPGNYLARLTIGEGFKFEEAFEIEEVIVEEENDDKLIEENKEADDNDEPKDDELDKTQGGPDNEEDPVDSDSLQPDEEDQVSIFGEVIATLAYGWDSLEWMLVAETVEPVQESVGGGVIPFSFMMMPLGVGGGNDLGNIFTFVSMTKGGNVINENDPVDVTDGVTITLDYKWDTVGLTVNPGDWSETDIPDAFKLDTDFIDKDIITGGIKVGKYSIINNKLKFVFDDGITEAGEISNGELGFGMEFNQTKFNKDIVQEVTFKGKTDKTFNVTAVHTGTVAGISKSGIATSDGIKVDENAKEITWTIDIMNPGTTEMTNASLMDTLPAGLTLDTTSIEITDLTVGLDGTVYEGNTSSISASSFPIAFGKIYKYKGYRVKYKTIIDNYALKEFTNDAKLSYTEGADLPADATVNEIKRSNPIEKTGKKSGEHKINWEIDINKAGGKVGQAIVNDTLPAGAILDTTSIKVYKLTGSGGTWSEALDTSKSFTSFPIDLGKLESTDAYRIKYTTNIDYSLVNGGNYEKENFFKNDASLHDDNLPMGTDEANVKITRSDLLKKTGGHNVSYSDKKLNWTVTVNQAKHPITNAVLTDQLPAGLKIAAGDITITRIGDGGETDSTNHTVTLNPTDGNGTTATDITINFDGTIKGTYEIKYSTTITDFTKESFDNTASFNGTGIGPGVTVAPVTVPVPNNSYTKKKGTIDHEKKTMSWTIEANPIREAIKTLTITDTFPNKGLILLEDTLKVKLGGVTEDLVKDTDYTLVANGAGYQEGFIIKLIGTKLPINNKLTIIYDTSYDTELYPQIIKNTADGTYKNNASFIGTTINERGISSNDDDSQKIVEASWNTGKKEGKLKSVNSNGDLEDGWISGNTRKIQWEVYINYQKHNIGSNIKVSDTLSYDGKVDMDSIEVRKYNVAGNGDTSITGSPIGETGNYSVISVEDGKGFELKFNSNVTERYAVVFTTSVPEISEKTYSNTAEVEGDSFTKVPYSTSVGFAPYDQILSKETIGISGSKVYTDDEIQWKVRINDALSTVTENVTVVDKISPGLIFNKDSVKVYKLRKSDGTDRVLVDKNEYTVTFENDETELKVVFNGSIDSTYEIEYSTIVTATTGDISNSVEYSGGNLDKKTVPAIKYSAEQFSYVGGDPAKGAIKITKVDGSKLLAGAEFEVWYELNGEDRQFTEVNEGVERKFVTDSDGELTIVNLPLRREYTIKEVKAPEGYVKKDNLVATIKVDNSAKANKSGAYPLTVENEKIKGNIEFTKINESDEPLVGVEFTLYKDGTKITTTTSDSAGLVSFTDVEYGDYTIKETKTLDGYILYSETLNASIGDGDNGKTVTPTKGAQTMESVTNIIKKGNLEIKKTDGEGNDLPGAKFKLYEQDSEGNLGDTVKKDGEDLVATSDASGIVKFTNIPYGDYIIKEFSAPDSYAPSTDEVKLSIENDGATVKPAEGDLGSATNPVVNTKVIGDVQVIKLDEDGETGLEGAEFILEQGGVEKYSGITDEFGSYVFKNVIHGIYTLKEKTPPTGYNPTTQVEEVEIKEQNQEIIIKKFINTKIRGDIKVKKVGESEEGLSGAIFSIYKSTDTEFKTPIGTATSNVDGEATFTDIAYGEYKIKEITAPTGYNLSDKVLDAKIETEGQEIDLINDPVSNNKIRGNIEILKRNRNTHNPLRGARIAIFTATDILRGEKDTEENGLVRFQNLEYGSYYFQETKAPSGYILDNNKYYFNILSNGSTITRNLDNSRIYYPPYEPDKPDPKDPPKKDPDKPVDPEDPDKPVDSEDPDKLVDPEDPDKPVDSEDPDKPVDPEDPGPVDPEDPGPVDPTDPGNLVEPNPPRVPEEFLTLVPNPPTKGTITFDEDGNWIYTPDSGATGKDRFRIIIDGKPQWIEIDLGDVPLGTTEVTAKTLPKTGAVSNLGFYLGGISLIFLGLFLRKKIA